MPSTPRGQRTRQLIIERTAAVFDELGFAGATLNHLVNATGLTRGAFYFHFDSKDALAEAIVQTQQERWLPAIDALRASEPDPMRRLIRITYRSGALFQGDRVMRAGSRLMTERSLIRRQLWRSYPWWVDTIRQLLFESADELQDVRHIASEAWPAPESVPPGIPREFTALAEHLVGMWTGVQQQAGVAGHNDLHERVRASWIVTLPWLCRDQERCKELQDLVEELTEEIRAAARAEAARTTAAATSGDAGSWHASPPAEDASGANGAPVDLDGEMATAVPTGG